MELFNIKSKAIPSDAVNIMRPGKWGNPFPEKQYGREGAIALYEHWLFLNPSLVNQMRSELRNSDIVCCCWPKPCHGNVIQRIVDKGEEPRPLPEDSPFLVAYLSLQKDELAPLVEKMQAAIDDPSRPRDRIEFIEHNWSLMKPHLNRILGSRTGTWPKPAAETSPVKLDDIRAWREEWLLVNAKNDGTDEVTPFDQYLYGVRV